MSDPVLAAKKREYLRRHLPAYIEFLSYVKNHSSDLKRSGHVTIYKWGDNEGGVALDEDT